MKPPVVPRLHVVTDDSVLVRSDFGAVARRVLKAGAMDLAFHVRGPHTSGATVYEMAKDLLEVAMEARACLVLNDRIDVMLGLGHAGEGRRPGVHLGRRSLPAAVARRLVGREMLLGCSTHDSGEVEKAVVGGADYVFFGHVFPTPSHEGRREAGVDGLAAAVRAGGDLPVVAIGGIEPSRVGEVLGAGAAGVAVLRGVWDAPAPEDAVRDYISAFARASGSVGEAAKEGGSS